MQKELDNEDDHIRSFEEFDEKLPNVAKVIVRRGINFSLLNQGDEETATPEQLEVFLTISAILREMVECTSEMTADEFEYYVDILLTGCEVVELVNSGLVCEREKGRFTLTSEGRSYYEELKSCEESSD